MRMDVAALLIATLLWLCQLLGLEMIAAAGQPKEAVRAISGFGQPVVITLICLFIITNALDRTGITRWLVGYLLKLGGKSEARLIPLFAGAAALLSLLMNNVAAGALLLPGAGILDFTPTGGLIALAGIGFLALFGRRLPERVPPAEQMLSRRWNGRRGSWWRGCMQSAWPARPAS
jgi:di/tricarboxylate transporter